MAGKPNPMSSTLTEIKRAVIVFKEYWETLDVADALNFPKATAIGWKVGDLVAFKQTVVDLIPETTQLHIGDVNDRKIGSFVLRQPLGMGGLQVVKVLQRRPGREDPLGFDHIDFTVPNREIIERILAEHAVPYEQESNDAHEWISARLPNGTEVKFVDHTVLDVCAQELSDASRSLL